MSAASSVMATSRAMASSRLRSISVSAAARAWLVARVGWNWQFGSLLFGVEHDFSFFNLKDENLREETYAASADFLGTLRGRVGWADDNVLFYATGGAAFLHADVRDQPRLSR